MDMPSTYVRSATFADRDLVSALLTSAHLRHLHLDWVPALDLTEDPLFMIALKDDLPRACLAAPPDPLPIAWIRIFAAAPEDPHTPLWEALWESLHTNARSVDVETIYSLALQPWFEPLISNAGFTQINEVIFYEWSGSAGVLDDQEIHNIRRMRRADLTGVEQIDHSAFAPAWQNSIKTLNTAAKIATYATVCEVEGKMVGYQISTASALGAHLARLAVIPAFQQRGIGRSLVVDMLKHIARRGFDRVTVNTQADNLSSQRLYNRLGFELTGQRYPMFGYHFPPA
jgi:ribosomal-protein-alanine N-acetyltransferase